MGEAAAIERLIEALRDPAAYAHGPASVSVVQTHASLLFFAGDRVYKVKKPVDYGFLNFSTPERRRHFCEEEVRLNRRLAPGVYLGVVPIVRTPEGAIRVGGAGETIEHAVEMRRLPAERMLDRLLERAEATPAQIDAIADRVLEFHQQARADDEVAGFGSARRVRGRIEGNLEECAALAGDLPDEADASASALTASALARLRAWTRAEVERLAPLLGARAAAGFVREGHGDLHAGNICLPEGAGVVAYDCLEFEVSFRCLDVAAEVAFLAMDLERRGFVEAAARFVDRYATRAGDADLHRLQALFRCHYACVRGKVGVLRARGPLIGADERAGAWREAVDSFHLALAYTMPATLLVMCGLPGTGKSWWATRLGAPLRARVIRSDEVRKALAGMAPTDRPAGERERDSLYNARMTDETYGHLREHARAALDAGRSVVIDATAPTRAMRQMLLETADVAGAPAALVVCECPEEVVVERLRRRAAGGADASDADEQVYAAARGRFEAPRAEENPIMLTCTQSPWRGVEQVLGRIGEGSPIPDA